MIHSLVPRHKTTCPVSFIIYTEPFSSAVLPTELQGFPIASVLRPTAVNLWAANSEVLRVHLTTCLLNTYHLPSQSPWVRYYCRAMLANSSSSDRMTGAFSNSSASRTDCAETLPIYSYAALHPALTFTN